MKNYVDLLENTDPEEIVVGNGYSQLSGREIKEQLVGKQFLGNYLHGIEYIISINADGSLEGKNTYQHYDIGSWLIDMEEGTMSVNWENGWGNVTTRIYEIGKEIRMYEKETGTWRTSLKQYFDKVQNIKNYQF